MDEKLLDDIIRRLLDAKKYRIPRQVQLTEAEIKQLCLTSRDVFLSQPNLLELEAPIKICGKVFHFSLFPLDFVSFKFLNLLLVQFRT